MTDSTDPVPLTPAQMHATMADGVRDGVALVKANLQGDMFASKALITSQDDGRNYAALLLGVVSVACSAICTVAANLDVDPLEIVDVFRQGYEQMIAAHESGEVIPQHLTLGALPEGPDGVEEWLRRNFTPDPDPEAPSE